MLCSIIVPVYNVEKYLDECMDSILSQLQSVDYDCEILLIDDGSTDKSGKMCDIYEKKYPSIVRTFHKENQGLLATRRYGFERALGDYIINCDSDDILENNMLMSVKSMINKYVNPDMILINFFQYDGKEKKVEYENIFTNKHDCKLDKSIVLNEYLSGHKIVSLCAKIVKRSCINVNMDYTEYGRLSTGEDTLQSIELFSNASTFVYLNEPLYNYRCGSGMTAKFDSNYFFTFKRIFEQIIKKKDEWNLQNFDKLFAIKVLQTAGRAVTQSRYNDWKTYGEEKKYLKTISCDPMLKSNMKYLDGVKNNLQFNHFVLLKLLNGNFFFAIIILLKIRNILSNN